MDGASNSAAFAASGPLARGDGGTRPASGAAPTPFWARGGPDDVYVIAEIGVNHNGRRDLALRLVDVAADAGAQAVKFQTFRTDEIVTDGARQADYQARNLGGRSSQADMLRALELSEEDYLAVHERCRARDIAFLSTPFDPVSADFLERLGVEGFKVSSGDLTHLPFLAQLARKGRAIILSTGMADLAETEAAVATIEAEGLPLEQLAVLHCVSNYPCAPEECNLRAMATIAQAFPGVTTGWSDHTEGEAVGLAAAGMDACRIIEKHFTLDRSMEGPDHKASLEPGELASFVAGVRAVTAALGTGRKVPTAAERETAKVARRVLVAARALEPGTRLTPADLAIKRAGEGLRPAMHDLVSGATLRVPLERGERLTLAGLDFS